MVDAGRKGANTMNGISFESGDPVKAQNDARAAAVAAARTSAQVMAAAGNVSLGASSRSPTPRRRSRSRTAALRRRRRDMATPVEPGTQDLTATVTVVFAIN